MLAVKDLPLPRFVVGKNEAEARHVALYQDPDSQGLYPASAAALIPRPPGRGHPNKKVPPSASAHPLHEAVQPTAPSVETQVCTWGRPCVPSMNNKTLLQICAS